MDPVMHRILFPFGVALVLLGALTVAFRKKKLERYFFGLLALICLAVTVYYGMDKKKNDTVQVTAVLVQEETGFYKEPGYRDLHFTVTETGEKISVCTKKDEAELILPGTEYVLTYAKRTGMLLSWYDPQETTEESTTDGNATDLLSTAPSATDESTSALLTTAPYTTNEP